MLVFIDLDNFKGINDQYGHKDGDAILKFVADNLRMIMRAEDNILFKSETDTFARLGGDEFVIVVSNIASADDSRLIVDRIEKSIDNRILNYNGHELKISLSIGMACYPSSGNTVDELMHAADVSMYQMKQAKKEWT